MKNPQNAIIVFECDDWGSCYQDIEQEIEISIEEVNDPNFEIEVQCDLCNKWRNETEIKKILFMVAGEWRTQKEIKELGLYVG